MELFQPHALPTTLFWLANIFYCLAYMIRDILWLRVFTIIACFTTFPYYWFQTEPLLSAIMWEIAFVVINAYNLVDLIRRRRPVVLNPEQQKLHLKALPNFSPREMLEFFKVAEEIEVPSGTIIIDQGVVNTQLVLIISGQMAVIANGEVVAQLKACNFVGEMSFVTGELTSADVVAAENCRYLRWMKQDLDKYLEKETEVASHLQSALGRDMANKIKAQQ